LGRFLKETDRPIQIATKYFPYPWRFTPQTVTQALDASLARLQLSSITLYLVHWPFSLMGEKSLMAALAQAVEAGKIQTVGVSNYSPAQMEVAHQILAEYGIPLAVNQVRYSLLARTIETNGTLDMARKLGMTILAYCPLAQGLLTGKYTVENYQPPTGARKLDPRFSRQGLQKLTPLIQLLTEIGQQHDGRWPIGDHRTPAQVSLNWLIAQQGVLPIPGAKNANQAKQNAGALGWQLTQDELAALDKVSRLVTR
jgi:aryl-alcohol dehydrogenase-like predicted oxidoreductase